jgi:hypothetical protein
MVFKNLVLLTIYPAIGKKDVDEQLVVLRLELFLLDFFRYARHFLDFSQIYTNI